MIETLPQLVSRSAARDSAATAICYKKEKIDYGKLLDAIQVISDGFLALGLGRSDRVAIYAEKRIEVVVSAFAAAQAGGVFVPVNPLLKPAQVGYILNDCAVRVLVTTASRLAQLEQVLNDCPALEHVVVLDSAGVTPPGGVPGRVPWEDLESARTRGKAPRIISSDMAAIMYTSGSTGMPKGVVLSHANMIIGAESVASYIGNQPSDRILAALPLSFDAGLSQVTTGICAGACIVLHNHLLPQDVVRIVEREQITGLTGVPPLWMQLADQAWPDGGADSLRYFANTGGKMPRDTLGRLRRIFPNAKPFLMYGLTEAFRSTYLPPEEVDRRPDSMGKAIPNVEVMVVASDGRVCGPGEVGELVHRGPLVSLGYWNDPERTAVRFKPAPGQPSGLPNPELAVWSGDSVKMDEDGFLYFVTRMDDMIKTSGYRVSPAELEEVVFDTGLVSEAAAIGVAHRTLGQAIVLVAKAKTAGDSPSDALTEALRTEIPNYMMPATIQWKDQLPRNANGKLDRRALAAEFADLFAGEAK